LGKATIFWIEFAHHVVVAVGLPIGGMNLDTGSVVIAQMAEATTDPDLVVQLVIYSRGLP
jgi:hypothetical protein